MKSSRRIVFEISKQSNLKKALEILKKHEREVAVQFKMDTSPLTPQIVDGEKKVRQQTEKLFDKWYTNHQK